MGLGTYGFRTSRIYHFQFSTASWPEQDPPLEISAFFFTPRRLRNFKLVPKVNIRHFDIENFLPDRVKNFLLHF